MVKEYHKRNSFPIYLFYLNCIHAKCPRRITRLSIIINLIAFKFNLPKIYMQYKFKWSVPNRSRNNNFKWNKKINDIWELFKILWDMHYYRIYFLHLTTRRENDGTKVINIYVKYLHIIITDFVYSTSKLYLESAAKIWWENIPYNCSCNF